MRIVIRDGHHAYVYVYGDGTVAVATEGDPVGRVIDEQYAALVRRACAWMTPLNNTDAYFFATYILTKAEYEAVTSCDTVGPEE